MDTVSSSTITFYDYSDKLDTLNSNFSTFNTYVLSIKGHLQSLAYDVHSVFSFLEPSSDNYNPYLAELPKVIFGIIMIWFVWKVFQKGLTFFSNIFR